jgi:hypothetical protein
MTNSIINFKNSFNGGSRANRFRVYPTWPTGIGINVTPQDSNFKIISASLPTLTVNSISVPYRGRLINFAGDRQYSPWIVGVYDDNNSQNLWAAFHRWKERLDGHITHKVANNNFSYSTLQTTWRVEQLDVNGTNVLRHIYLYKCWPSVVGEIGLNMGDNNLVSFQVTLTFDHLKIDKY